MKTMMIVFLALALMSESAKAEILIYNHDDFTVGIGGILEIDTIYDTTRSLAESPGNAAIARKGTFDGENSRTQFSMRNSRLSLSLGAPVVDGWKPRGYLETDFLGYDPSATAANSQSESAYSSSPTLRIRHAYVAAQKDSLQILAGQTWTLFGWEPQYVLSTVSVAPVAGTLYQRSIRLGAIDTLKVDDVNSLDLGIAVVRPTQRDSAVPNLDLGVRWADEARKSGFAAANSDIKTQALSFGVSGTFREFESPTSVSDRVYTPAFGMALNTLIPILASSDGKSTEHTLSLLGEFTAGRGYGDEFPGFTGGLVQQSVTTQGSSTNGTNLNLDSGLGGYNAQGSFELVQLRTWNSQLQYHWLADTFSTVGYGQLYSSNISDFNGGVNQTATKLYDRSEIYFLNLVHDFTRNVRLAVEVEQLATHYIDGSNARDNRFIMAAYYRF